ncbi:uncharacterized protein LOC128205452 isoform X2 [Mya arenaria]|uniref:uncharacterized protein LOC128205452 isoform X2 n=1 Tax=Mya arenaria TaxID=6604 RepID=UPI0022E218D3|nr:uncharacterized protein LOC128205452 isoform X2 [Mya arenaria]
MPTLQTDGRTHPKLPDIFRTINGVNVDLGPLDRLRDADGEGATANTGSAGPLSWGRGKEGGAEASGGMCPRIILRDALGRQLDTFTTLQEAIYRAKWNVQQTGQAKTPIEWRLPKAPPPARPDLTRTFPPLKHPPVHGEGGARSRPAVNHSRVLEFDVKDVGFVQESLQYLPYAPSLSFLRQEILVGPKTYFQIVGTLLLHKRILSQTEKRQAVHNFPGFCSGCIRMGLCYGCERSSQPHFHEDKPVKTGGGFTYYKKDRPEHEIPGKNPINWKIQHPDRALKKLMEDFAGVELEGALPDEIKRHLDKHGGHRERLVTSDTTGRGIGAGDQRVGRKGTLADIQVQYGDHGDDHGDDLEGGGDGHAINRPSGDSINRSRDHVLDPSDVDIEMLRASSKYGQGQGDMPGYQGHHSSVAGSETDQHGRVLGGRHYGKAVPGSELTGYDRDTMAKHAGGQGANALNQGKGNHYERFEHRLPKLRKKQSDDLEKKRGQEGDSGSEMDGQTDTDTDTTSRGRRRKRLYKPPPAFKLKKSPHRSIDSRSPFSTDRNYDLPKGSGFQLKKSDKKLTEFKDFRNVDVSWKEPKKFELKKIETKTTTFWSGSPKKKEKSRSKSRSPDRKIRRVPSPRALSPDSGLDSEQLTDTTNRSELEPVREETTITLSPEPVMEREITPQPPIIKSPDIPKSVTPPPKKKREIVKKEKKVAPKPRTPEPPPPPSPEPTLPPITKATSPSPEPSDDEPQPSREISFVRVRSIPELPPIEVPELPDIPEKQPYEPKVVKKEMKVIEVTPELPEPKKKLPPPPKLGPKIKSRTTSRKSKVAEAPVTAQEIQQLTDPLDFLAKYCIINPDRLPFYERIFNGAVSVQSPRYVHQQSPPQGAPLVKLPPAQLSAHELAMLKDLTVISHAQSPRKEGMSVPEQYLEKLNYSIEFIQGKQESIQEHMHALQSEKVELMAQIAKSMDRDIVRLDYKGKGKKKKKKKKKKKSSEGEYDLLGSMVTALKNFRPTKASDITDEVIVSRMDEKMMKKAKKDPAVKTLSLGINRDIEKLKAYEQRISQIEDEKDLVGLYCMDYYFNEQNARAPPYEFRRQQSRLYQKLHPDPDIEMNLDEVEAALQQVNNKLLTQKEFQYIYFVLDLPKREKINFRMFSIVAALSEKVTQMDPVIRKLINKVDHNALDVKMEKSKELFRLLQDESQLPLGNCTADLLAVELTAGGLTPEHTSYVLSKFNREGRGFADFLDFVTYVPLFIEIHKRIIEDPFNETLNV